MHGDGGGDSNLPGCKVHQQVGPALDITFAKYIAWSHRYIQ